MSWTALIPIKPPEARKTRLVTLDPDERVRLSERLLDHVIATLRAHPGIGRVVLLSNDPRSDCDRIQDHGRGLNAELTAARAELTGDILIIHADLPLVSPDDLTALFAAAMDHGAALAQDRHGIGTNALALRSNAAIEFRFGPHSRRLHAAQMPAGSIVDRPGLALDIDTPEDLLLI